MDIEDGSFIMKHKANLKLARYPNTEWGGYSLAVAAQNIRDKGRRCISVPSGIPLGPVLNGEGKEKENSRKFT